MLWGVVVGAMRCEASMMMMMMMMATSRQWHGGDKGGDDDDNVVCIVGCSASVGGLKEIRLKVQTQASPLSMYQCR